MAARGYGMLLVEYGCAQSVQAGMRLSLGVLENAGSVEWSGTGQGDSRRVWSRRVS